MKIHPVGAEFFHADGWTGMTKLIVTLGNFANATKNPCSVPKEDQVSRLYMDLYSAA